MLMFLLSQNYENLKKLAPIVICHGEELVRIDYGVECDEFAAVGDWVRRVTEDVHQRFHLCRVLNVLVTHTRHVVLEVQTQPISRLHPRTSPDVCALEIPRQLELATNTHKTEA